MSSSFLHMELMQFRGLIERLQVITWRRTPRTQRDSTYFSEWKCAYMCTFGPISLARVYIGVSEVFLRMFCTAELYYYQVTSFITDVRKKWKQTTFRSVCVQFKPKCNNLLCTYLCVHVTTLCWIASSHNLIRLLNASLWLGRSLWAAKRASAWLNLAV